MDNEVCRTVEEKFLDDYINGNYSDCKKVAKRMTKLDILDLIEFCQSMGTGRHITICILRKMLR
jgi:hypothetical protein